MTRDSIVNEPVVNPAPAAAEALHAALAFGFPRDVSLHACEPDRLPGPVIATAIHDGHRLPWPIERRIALEADARRREEDPFTRDLISGCPWQIVVHRSRFAADLNRAREQAVYRTPDEAWGLALWKTPPDPSHLALAQGWHDHFYRALAALLDDVAARHPRFVVLDVHSYNHRRGGPDASPTPTGQAPDINLGTASMPPGRWDTVLDHVRETARTTLLPDGRALSVGDNIAFQGRGELARFVHTRYPERGCAVAIEVKKIFMDEWTGAPDSAVVEVLRDQLFARLASRLTRVLGR